MNNKKGWELTPQTIALLLFVVALIIIILIAAYAIVNRVGG